MSSVRINSVDKEVNKIIEYRKKQTPHLFISKQNLIADLVVKEAKRIERLMEGDK